MLAEFVVCFEVNEMIL